jgi:hypothetical protein
MEKVAYIIRMNKYAMIGSYAFVEHDKRDEECYTAGLYSIATHIYQKLKYYLNNEVRNIYIYNNLDTPVVYFKYGIKEGNIMEVKDMNGKFYWLVKLFDVIV